MTLSEAKIGDTVKIVGLQNGTLIKQRLKTMGLRVGVTVKVMNIAPLKTPIEIKADNFRLAICKAEADKITVEYV